MKLNGKISVGAFLAQCFAERSDWRSINKFFLQPVEQIPCSKCPNEKKKKQQQNVKGKKLRVIAEVEIKFFVFDAISVCTIVTFRPTSFFTCQWIFGREATQSYDEARETRRCLARQSAARGNVHSARRAFRVSIMKNDLTGFSREWNERASSSVNKMRMRIYIYNAYIYL